MNDRKVDDSPTLIFLHGFTGSHQSFLHIFEELKNHFTIVAPDLLGHGQTDSPSDYKRFSTAEQVADIFEIIQLLKLSNPILIGYSMGARLALQFGVMHSNELSGLILESGTFGIRNSFDAENRRKTDKELAYLIRTDFNAFLKTWEDLPLFDTKKPISNELLSQVKKIRSLQLPQGLASSLLGFGTGSMPALFYDELRQVNCPVLLITGEHDVKFTNHAVHMQRTLKSAEHYVIKDSGHRVHLESPISYINAIQRFLKSI